MSLLIPIIEFAVSAGLYFAIRRLPLFGWAGTALIANYICGVAASLFFFSLLHLNGIYLLLSTGNDVSLNDSYNKRMFSQGVAECFFTSLALGGDLGIITGFICNKFHWYSFSNDKKFKLDEWTMREIATVVICSLAGWAIFLSRGFPKIFVSSSFH